MTKPSVFDDSLKLPETVVILGSGVNAPQGLPLITDKHFVIAMNKSALSLDREPDLYMCHAHAPLKIDWWQAINKLKCTKAFGRATIEKSILWNIHAPHDYQFVHDPGWWLEPPKQFVHGLLRSGGTISGAAIQLCFWKGVKRVYLCGVDMFGNVYFDGSKADPRGKQGKTWKDLHGIETMIDYAKRNSEMQFYTISDSKIRIERVNAIG